MWQRIQSVFLGLSILSLAGAMFMPFWEGHLENHIYRLYPIYLMAKTDASPQAMVQSYLPYCANAVLIVAAVTIAIQAFRRYDNRMLQVKLGLLNSLIIAGVMICAILFSNALIKEYPGIVWQYDYALYFTFAATVFNWLAMRFIRRDEKLVRDSERLR